MKTRGALRVILAVLWALVLTFYIASKVDFFTRYTSTGLGNYLREHSLYWAAMAVTAFVIWLIERFFRHEKQV
jgi:hypothetical protein